MLAHVYWALGQKEKAVNYYQESILLAPDEETFLIDYDNDWNFLIKKYGVSAHDYQQMREQLIAYRRNNEQIIKSIDSGSIQDVIRMVEANPQNFTANYELGNYYKNKERNYDLALKYYLQAESLNPHHSNLLEEIALCYREKNELSKSADYYKKSDALKPNNTWILKNIGWCYSSQDKYEEALKYHLKVFELDPTDAWNLSNTGWCYLKLKDFAKALEYLLLAERQSPRDGWALGKAGWCYYKLGNYEKSLEYHLKAQSNHTTEPSWNLGRIAQTYLALKDVEKAQTYIADSLAIEDDAYFRIVAGHIWLCSQKIEEALKNYKNAAARYSSWNNYSNDFEIDRQAILSYGIPAETIDNIKKQMEDFYEKNKDGGYEDNNPIYDRDR
jgi:tetratricopeptide (TPR) repeat protein